MYMSERTKTYPVPRTNIVHVGRWTVAWLDELVNADASLIDADLEWKDFMNLNYSATNTLRSKITEDY